MKCAVLDDYQGLAHSLADWGKLKIEAIFFNKHFFDEASLVDAIKDCEIVVAMRERTTFDRALLEKLTNLKLLITTARRNPSIDILAAESMGITVCGTDAKTYPTAELTWALILALVRHVPFEDTQMRLQKNWQMRVGVDIYGKTLGLLGLGTIGIRVARVAQAFDMKVIAWSNNLTRERCEENHVEYVSKDELLSQSDILSIHTQLSKRTEGLIGHNEFAKMKPAAYLINTSRAFIVNEEALLDALDRKLIAGAGIDVYEAEPLAFDHPLRSRANTVLTPHIGYVSEDNYRMWFAQIVENIDSWLGGKVIRRMDPAININRSL
ncbi:MAG: D-2-hydroxyacid dehydrogenase family protein [Limnohabitans sp.]|nr:D-2-hydroxyacid dehydrogenase family protein [Limnohabitans sp.]